MKLNQLGLGETLESTRMRSVPSRGGKGDLWSEGGLLELSHFECHFIVS